MLWEVFMEAVLCKCDWLTYQPLITEHYLQPAPLLSLKVQGGIEKSNLITTLLVLQATSPIQRCLQKSPRSHNKRHRHCAPHLCNSKGFKSPVPEMGTKTTYIFLTINHTITGGKAHISFGMCLELIPPSFKKSTPVVLGGTKFYSQSPKVDRCWRSGQSESHWPIQWWTQDPVRPIRPSLGIFAGTPGKEIAWVRRPTRKTETCKPVVMTAPTWESLPWNWCLYKGKQSKDSERERGARILTLFETGSNQTWNNTYPWIFQLHEPKKYFFLTSFCLSQFEYGFLFKP